MSLEDFVILIQNIVKTSCELKDKFINQQNALVNYACVFCQNQKEYNNFFNLAQQLGEMIKDTPTGPLFYIKGLDTVSGKLRLLKIRKPDSARLERGDADFTISNYSKFKSEYLNKPGFSLIQRENFEMIELINPNFNTRAYFSNPPLDQQLGIITQF